MERDTDVPQESATEQPRLLTWTGVVARGAAWGAAYGLFLGACLIAAPIMNSLLAWWLPEMPDLVLSIAGLSALAKEKTGIGSAAFWSFPFLVMAAASILGVIGSALARCLRLDRKRHARDALLWAAPALLRPVGVWILWALAAAAGILFSSLIPGGDIWIWLIAAIGVWLILLPFGMLRREVAASEDGARWWFPHWPGLHVLLSLLTLLCLTTGLSLGADRLPDWLNKSLAPLMWVLESSLTLAMGFVLLNRLGLAGMWRRRCQWLSWDSLGTFLLLQIRLCMLALWILTAALPVYVLMWKSVPVLASYLDGSGRSVPLVLSGLIATAGFLGEYWWVLFMVLGLPYVCLATSRYIALLSTPAPEQA